MRCIQVNAAWAELETLLSFVDAVMADAGWSAQSRLWAEELAEELFTAAVCSGAKGVEARVENGAVTLRIPGGQMPECPQSPLPVEVSSEAWRIRLS